MSFHRANVPGYSGGASTRRRKQLAVEPLEQRLLLTVPAVLSIDRDTPLGAETNAANVSYAVTFNESVANVASDDFLVITTGSLVTATPVVVSGSGSTYSVTVNDIDGSGDLRLDLVDDDSIVDDPNVPLGGAGPDNGNFQGQTYTIDQENPFVKSINRANQAGPIFSGSNVSFTVTFSEPVTGVDPSDFTRVTTGALTTTIPLVISGSDAVYTVVIDGIAGDGTLGLNLTDDGSIRDLAGNQLGLSDPLTWSFVGDPGNAGQLSGVNAFAGGGPNAIVGAVDYAYRIGTYDVTNSQYVALLNAKDPTGTNSLGLYKVQMGTDAVNGGISFNSAGPEGSKYSVVAGRGNRPVNYVTWYNAIRFANWVNNGQGNSDTESGAYTLFGGTPTPSNASVIFRNPTASVFLPSENEWYKAAYYNPATHSYFIYATGSNALPNYLVDPQDSNAANYTPGGWPNPDYDLAIGHVTDVGAFASTRGPYGTYDQSGNVMQWVETTIMVGNSARKGLRGGAFNYVWDHITNGYRSTGNPFEEFGNVGFRLASVTTFNADFTGQVYTNDVTPPVATSIALADASPTGALVVRFTVTFSESVTGVDATDFALVANGQGVGASISSFAGSGTTYTLAALLTPTAIASGTLGLNLVDNDSIVDEVGNRLGGTGAGNGSVTGSSYAISRNGYAGPYLFYRGSTRYDTTGNPQTPRPFSDDNAIAADKVAYLAGSGVSTFANMSSYSRGINGIMVDIPIQHGTITAQDFVFKVGNNNAPGNWAPAPAPISVTVRSGAGEQAWDRVELIWADKAIQKQWLQVIMKGNDALGGNNTNTGLGSSNVFYFGHALGDTGLGDTATLATVDVTDELQARNYPATLFSNIPITNIRDFNRDGIVDVADVLTARNNKVGPATATRYLNIGVGSSPNAPAGDGGGGAGSAAPLAMSAADALVASGNAPSGGSSSMIAPTNLVSSPASTSVNTARVDSSAVAQALHQIVAEGDSRIGSALEDDALAALLADLGLG
jgi:formylglycine-generating enzyme required for sulfatase activity